MAKTENQKTFRWQAQKPLLATALAVAGIFNMMTAVLAQTAAAGSEIENTATATYDDGDPDTPVSTTTSNKVIVKVAEIAGLTAVARPVIDEDGGAIEADDALDFLFDVTNVGNADTNVYVPGADLVGSTNVDVIEEALQVYSPDDLTTPIGTVAVGGGLVIAPDGTTPVVFAPGETFVVKVEGTAIPGTAAGAPVSVTLGNTQDNTDDVGTDPTQNQPDIDVDTAGDAAANPDDLRTVDADPATAPANGEREAEATASAPYADSVKPLALATVLKVASNINAGDATDPTDDLITYDLGLRVENTAPIGTTYQPAALDGKGINLDGAANTKRILVSDAIPVGTSLTAVGTSLPAGWTAVYTVDTGNNPLVLPWTTTPPTELDDVTRVGFVYTGTIAPTGVAITGLEFTVVAEGVPATGALIENIAQVFGSTPGDDPTDPPVYDESGDDNPNNYDPDPTTPNFPDDGTGVEDPNGGYVPGDDDGIPTDLDTDNNNQPDSPDDVDGTNNNQGDGPDGEHNVVSLSPTTDDILNGTKDFPQAVGPNGDNDDFTNKTSDTPAAGIDPTAPFDPDEVIFDNSLSNPGTGVNLSNVTIEPLSPSQADQAADPLNPTPTPGPFGDNGDIPDGTVVTIKVIDKDGILQEPTYTYDETTGDFVLTTGTPLNVGDVAPGEEVDYKVTVDLPDTAIPTTAYPIPIVAFPDDDPDLSPGYTGETVNNITIDRVYTGFMELVKTARVLDADGNERIPFSDGTGIADPDDATNLNPALDAAPGEFIEYRLEYKNISEVNAGSGNAALTAEDFTLLEDGNANAATNNNWAEGTTHTMNTVATDGSVNYYTTSGDPATLTPASANVDPADGTVIDMYTNVVPTVGPQNDGEFTFRRVVNE